jgi:integrase
MARTVRNAALESRTARGRLQARGKPHYCLLEEGLHLGYRKPREGAGKWVAREYRGEQTYEVTTIATADDFSDADGEWILNYKQAQERARRRMVEQVHGAAATKGKRLDVRAAVEEYISFLESSRKSAGDARYRAEAFIYPELGDVSVEGLTTKRIRDWLNAVAKAAPRVRTRKGEKQKHREASDDDEAIRRRRSTANRTLTILKAALNRQWREGNVPSDAAWRRVEPFEAVEAARVRYLTVAEAKRLINASDAEDFRPLVQAGLLTGARYGELGRLQVHDFNADTGTLAVRVSKSGKSRHVELTDEGVKFFREHCAGRPGDELMFRKRDGSAWGKSHQLRPMAEACARAKILPPIGFHGLRHTWASLAVMNGVPLLVVAKNLGHSDGRMVEKHYGHLAESYVRDAIRAGAPKFGLKGSKVIAIRG